MVKDVIYKKRHYKDSKGNDKTDIQFYLVLENGKSVRIAPYYFNGVVGKEWNTFKELFLIAHEEKEDD